MRLNINDLKIGDKVFIFDKRDGRPLVYDIVVEHIQKFTNGDYSIGSIIFDNSMCELYTTYEECVDRIRTLNHIRNFDDNSFTWYINYLKDAINLHIPVYVIRERKHSSKRDRYLDKSYIIGFYYDGVWKVKTKSVDKYIKTIHLASSLGLRIFFDKDNAIKKLSTLKGGLN